MNKKTKRGFTIVELVIVIAVIAILAAVLIPTFASVIKKANLSADQQAVTTMNKQLAIADVDEDIDSLPEAITALAKAGLDLEDYKPLTKDHYFYFTVVDGTPTIILADKNDDIVFPAGLTKEDTTSWYSLSGITPVEKVDIVENNAVVNNGAQLAYVIDAAKTGKEEVSNVTLNADVNLRGAGVDFGKVKSNLTIDGNGNKTISNGRSDENALTSTGGEFAVNEYGFGFIGTVEKGATVTIKDVTLEGFFSGNTIGNHEKGANTVGLIAGYVYGTLILENVTIKNSTVYGYQKVGAIVGQILGGEVILKNVTFENVTVIGNTEVATIAGIMNSTATITLENTTTDGITVESTAKGQFKGSEITPNAELTSALSAASLSLNADSYFFICNNVAQTSFWFAGAVTTDWAWYAPTTYVRGSTLFNLMYNGKNATNNGIAYEFSSYPFTYKG